MQLPKLLIITYIFHTMKHGWLSGSRHDALEDIIGMKTLEDHAYFP